MAQAVRQRRTRCWRWPRSSPATRPVGSHHILEAMLQQPDSAAAKVLSDAGIDLDQLAAKLDEVSTKDTADDTPEQAAARQLELSVTDEAVTVVLRDPGSLELGKQIVQLNGGPLAARGPQLDLLGRLWAAVNDWLGRHRACAGTPAGCIAGCRGEVVHSRPALTIPPP